MGRYTGPVEKLSRREGVDLGLKGERALNGKGAMERRPYPPGEHGRGRRRETEYSLRMRAKQRAKRTYGLREKQFRNLVNKAGRREGRAGENLLQLLELRLDNVVYRLGFASTRAQARQFIVHQHVLVDGERVNRPSYSLRPGQQVAVKPGSPVVPAAQRAAELVGATPNWLLSDVENLKGTVERVPEEKDFTEPLDEQLIVEHYARL